MASQLPSKKVLIVDDNADAANLTAELLTLHGHQTETAYDGSQALLTALRFVPDVILLDLGMPMLDGFEVATRLRQMPLTERTVLIAYTAWNDGATERKTQQYGFDEHVAKPADMDHLLLLISTAQHKPHGDRNEPR